MVIVQDQADGIGHDLLVLVGHPGQQIAHETHSTALPAGHGEDLTDGILQPFMSVTDDQVNPFEPTLQLRAQEGKSALPQIRYN